MANKNSSSILEDKTENIVIEGAQKKCFFGLHTLKLIDIISVVDGRNDVVGHNYVLQCVKCGTIKTKFVNSRTTL